MLNTTKVALRGCRGRNNYSETPNLGPRNPGPKKFRTSLISDFGHFCRNFVGKIKGCRNLDVNFWNLAGICCSGKTLNLDQHWDKMPPPPFVDSRTLPIRAKIRKPWIYSIHHYTAVKWRALAHAGAKFVLGSHYFIVKSILRNMSKDFDYELMTIFELKETSYNRL